MGSKNSMESTGSMNSMDCMESMESMGTMASMESVEAIESMDSMESIDCTDCMESMNDGACGFAGASSSVSVARSGVVRGRTQRTAGLCQPAVICSNASASAAQRRRGAAPGIAATDELRCDAFRCSMQEH